MSETDVPKLTLQSLPDDLLGRCFLQVPFRQRRVRLCMLGRQAISLVCRRWAAIAAAPSPMWEEMHLTNSYWKKPQATNWLATRASAIKALHCSFTHEYTLNHLRLSAGALFSMMPSTLSALTLQVSAQQFGVEDNVHLSQLKGLRALTLNVDFEAHMTSERLALPLAQLTELQDLRLCSTMTGYAQSALDVRIPSSLLALASLQHFELKRYCIGKADRLLLPDSFGNWASSLQSLVLEGYMVERLPQSITTLTALKAFTMLWARQGTTRSARRQAVPPVNIELLVNLHGVEHLSVSGTAWHPLLHTTTRLHKLSTLKLCHIRCTEHNNFATPASFSGLRKLSLTGCELCEVPESIICLSKLIHLSLNHNLLSRLADGPYLSRLQYLSLWANRLTDVPACLSGATALRYLNLAMNLDFCLSPAGVQLLTSHLPALRYVNMALRRGERHHLHFTAALVELSRRLALIHKNVIMDLSSARNRETMPAEFAVPEDCCMMSDDEARDYRAEDEEEYDGQELEEDNDSEGYGQEEDEWWQEHHDSEDDDALDNEGV